MKIKRNKQLNLPQLMEWAWENDIRDSEFQTVKDERGVFYEVCFSEDGSFYSDDELDSKDTFTVEVEEEITEDTEIKGLVELGDNGHGTHFFLCNGSSINEQKDIDSEAFYILNDDKTMTLIWTQEKGLVE